MNLILALLESNIVWCCWHIVSLGSIHEDYSILRSHLQATKSSKANHSLAELLLIDTKKNASRAELEKI
jgi:hypothetical protein